LTFTRKEKVYFFTWVYRKTGSVERKEGSGGSKMRNEENIETVQVIEE
jgi:hypothetical protein